MTYTKFEVKGKKDAPYIPEYKIQLPEEEVNEIAVLPEEKPLQNQLKGPEILLTDSDRSRVGKPINIFYFGAALLSIVLFLSTAFLLKYAYDNDIYAPKKVCEFFRRVSYSFENKSAAAFASCPIEEKTVYPAILPLQPENNPEPEYDSSNIDENAILHAEESAIKDDAIPVTHTEETIKSELGEDAFPIIKADVSHFGECDLINDTNYTPDLKLLSESESVFANSDVNINPDEPLILIYHTHATECYSPASDFYTANTPTRSKNIENNIVSIGKELQNVLLSFGLNTIHCETLHDYNSFNTAYSNSYKSIKRYLEMYPSIKYIIDVHRDSIVKSNGEKIKTYAVVNGEETAQVMLVVGTDAGGRKHPDWEKNLSFAVKVENEINSNSERLARPINLRKASFNQELCDNALLLEVGSCGNTRAEAEKAVKMFGIAYAKVIIEELKK